MYIERPFQVYMVSSNVPVQNIETQKCLLGKFLYWNYKKVKKVLLQGKKRSYKQNLYFLKKGMYSRGDF